MRSKEEADDYRYFAEPDLTAPFHIADEFLQQVKESIPALPENFRKEIPGCFALACL